MPKSLGRFNKILSPDACRTHPLPWLLPELWGIQPRKAHTRTQKTTTVSAHLSPPRHTNCPCSRSVQGRKGGRSPRNRGPPLLSETAVVGRARGCRLRPGARARAATPSLPLASKMERRLRVQWAQIELRLAPRPTARRRRRGKGGAGEGRFSVHAFAWEAAPRRRGSLWAAPAPLTWQRRSASSPPRSAGSGPPPPRPGPGSARGPRSRRHPRLPPPLRGRRPALRLLPGSPRCPWPPRLAASPVGRRPGWGAARSPAPPRAINQGSAAATTAPRGGSAGAGLGLAGCRRGCRGSAAVPPAVLRRPARRMLRAGGSPRAPGPPRAPAFKGAAAPAPRARRIVRDRAGTRGRPCGRCRLPLAFPMRPRMCRESLKKPRLPEAK